MTDSEHINRLGGTNAVANLCGLPKSSISRWRKRGIPKNWRKYLAERQQHRELFLIDQELERQNYKKGALAAFKQHQRNAKRRKISWELNFEQWWNIWQSSGKWNLRGPGPGYCMARKKDIGPYSVENVYICTIGQNFADSQKLRHITSK